jgi:predicted MFS family arabinose efflux permease
MTGIANGQRDGWGSDKIVGLFALALASGTAFLWSQRRPSANLLDLELFRNPRFCAAVSVSFMFGFGSFATVYIFPVFAQIVQGYTPTVAGSLLLPGSIAAGILLPFIGRLADHFAPPVMIIVGMLVYVGATIMMAGADVNTVFWTIAIYLLISRIGVALSSPYVMGEALNALSPAQLRQGAGTANLCLMLGGALGINALVVTLERRVEFHSDAFTATQTSANSATREMLDAIQGLLNQSGVPDALHQPLALHHLARMIEAQANTLAFQDGYLALAGAGFLAIFPVFLLIWKRSRP